MHAMTTLPSLHPIRSGARAGMLSISLMEVAASFCVRSLRLGGARAMTPRERAYWLQEAASTVLRRIGVEVVADGYAPLEGLVISNHLSYLDVLAYASTMPCAFVAKREVSRWPVFMPDGLSPDTPEIRLTTPRLVLRARSSAKYANISGVTRARKAFKSSLL